MLKRLAILLLPIFLYAQEPIRLTADSEPLLNVEDCVNVLSGDFFYRETDIAIDTPIPLTLNRVYDSNHLGRSEYGLGMFSEYPHAALMHTSDSMKTNLQFEERGGLFLPYNWGKIGQDHIGKIDKEKLLELGVTNTGSVEGRGRLEGRKMGYKGWSKDNAGFTGGMWDVTCPDGTKRLYKYWGRENGWGQFVLEEETLPSGHKLLFDYIKREGSWGRFHFLPKKISLASPDGGRIFASIDLQHGENFSKAKGSNGQEFEIKLRKKKVKLGGGREARAMVPERTQANWKGGEHFDIGTYVKAGEPFKIREFSFSDGRITKVAYHSDGKVSEILYPTGRGEAFQPAFKFLYEKEKSTSEEIGGAKTIYAFSKEGRVLSKEIYDKQTLYRKEAFFWHEGEDRDKLKGVALLDAEGGATFLKKLEYDKEGAVVKETYYGNLTGEGEDTFRLDSDMNILDQTDSYSLEKYFSNNEFHTLLWDTAPNKVRNEYQYLPGTNLVSAKLVGQAGAIKERTFYEYDENHFLTCVIQDDGSGYVKDDLTACTYRTYEKKGYHLEEGPACGYPSFVEEGYVDLQTGGQVLLGRIEYEYNECGLKVAENYIDANGNLYGTKYFSYDLKRRCISETDLAGRTTHFEYDEYGRKILEFLEESGKTTYFTYNAMGKVIEEREFGPFGQQFATSFTYDRKGNLLSKTDPFGKTRSFGYDFLNRKVSESNTRGKTRTFSYDVSDNEVCATDEEGNSFITYFTPYQKPYLKEFPDGTQERYVYDLSGQLIKKTEKDGTFTKYGYDYRGRVVLEEVYDANGEFLCRKERRYKGETLLWEKEPDGKETFFEYDGAGRKIAEISGSRKKEFIYDSRGKVAETLFFDGGIEAYREVKAYDALLRVVEEYTQSPSGAKYRRQLKTYSLYDQPDKISKEVSPGVFIHSFKEYDWQGRVIKEEDEEGSCTTYTYCDQSDPYVVKRSPTGLIEKTFFNGEGQVVKKEHEDPFGRLLGMTQFYYDNCGKEIHSITENRVGEKVLDLFVVSKEYDSMGRIICRKEQPSDKASKVERYAYDERGRQIEWENKNGVSVYRNYSPLGYLESIHSSDHSIAFSFERDLLGRPLKVVNQLEGTESVYEYNLFGDVVFEKQESGLILSYIYDDLGRVKELTLPDQSKIGYRYEGSFLKTVLRNGVEHTYSKRDSFGRPEKISLADNGLACHYRFDGIGRVREISAPQYEETLLEFDKEGNLLKKALEIEGEKIEESFVYDSQNRLIKEEGKSSHNYVWDYLGNRKEKDGEKISHSRFNEIEKWGERNYSHSRMGERLEDDQARYRYDALGQLSEIILPEKTIKFSCDDRGRRVKEEVFDSCGNLVENYSYFYLGLYELGRWNQNQIDQLRILGSGACSGAGLAISYELYGEVYYPVHNYRGDTVLLLDKEGSIQEKMAYSAFGEEKKEDYFSPWRFSENRIQGDTGLYFFPRRVFDPKAGVWLSPDPAGEVDGLNLYLYSLGNPLSFIDPLGLAAELILDENYEKRANEFARINSFTPVKYFKPFFSDLYTQTGKTFSNISLSFINGILVGRSAFKRSMAYLGDLIGGLEIGGVHNASFGFFADLFESFNNIFKSIATDPAIKLARKWQKDLEKNPDRVILHTCHSQGVAHTKNALQMLSEEQRLKIHVLAVAPSTYIPKDLCASVLHLVAQTDYVPFIDKRGLNENIDTVKFLGGSGRWFQTVRDHFFDSPVYSGEIVKWYEKKIEEFGN